MQDSVLPQGVGLRKPHIFSFPSLLSPFSPLPPYFFLLTPHSLITASAACVILEEECEEG